MPFLGIEGEVSEVHRGGRGLCVDWRIPGFLDLPLGFSDYYDSPAFDFYEARWHLRVWPNWRSYGRVDLSLCREDDAGPSTRTVIVSMGLRRSGGGAERRLETELKFGKGEGWPLEDICKRSELRGDALTIVCQMKVPGTTVRDQPVLKDKVLAEEIQSSEKEAVEELQSSLRSLLKNEDDCDVTIKVQGKEFRAHRLILQARSPVFQAMFAHDMVEKQKGQVTMEDCDPETFSDFLEHVYTGSIGMISADNVISLYSASEKYDLKTLKKECARFVERNVTVASFCDVMTLAVKHSEDRLTERATEFFCRNSLDIVKTTAWQIFLEENPTVGNELLVKLLSKHENIFRDPDQGKK